MDGDDYYYLVDLEMALSETIQIMLDEFDVPEPLPPAERQVILDEALLDVPIDYLKITRDIVG